MIIKTKKLVAVSLFRFINSHLNGHKLARRNFMTLDELGQKIHDISKLKGHFKLRSGLTSEVYFDKYRFESQPQILKAIAEHMAPMIPEGTQVLAGLEMGGIPIATALSMKTNIPVAFIRKEAKEYGTCQFAEGVDIKGKKLCLIEDVVTTGGQVLLSTKDLRKEGAIVQDVLSVLFRGSEPPQKMQEAELNYKFLLDFRKFL